MINKLTAEQEKKLSEYRDKWLEIGLSTKQININKAIEIKDAVYKTLLEKNDVPCFLMRSPMEAFIATMYLASFFYEQSQVRSQVRSQVGSQVGSQVESQVGSQVGTFFWSYLYGHMDAGYFSFYDFMFNELGIKNPVKDKYNAYLETTKSGVIYPCDEFCVISNKPTKILMKNGRLHCDGGTAWEYSDGLKGWALNGIAVPQYLAETPEGKLDLEFFKKETNADVKAEFVRKYGVERMLSYGKKVDSHEKYNDEWWSRSEYELWDMKDLFGLPYVPYLKMRNLTTGVWHVEAVEPSCMTIPDAIKYRFGGKDLKITNIK